MNENMQKIVGMTRAELDTLLNRQYRAGRQKGYLEGIDDLRDAIESKIERVIYCCKPRMMIGLKEIEAEYIHLKESSNASEPDANYPAGIKKES